ncbi:MAG: DNA-3-methyladenine glycosylase 2 family protein, partial [Desulfovibrio sp.]|nr:DNA-3-methyladenine glycosylase 2 family protein [Desulfovibrio sp.]
MLKKSVFPINEEACSYLASREPRLGQAMARLKPPRRWGYDDLFVALLHSITGQQISSKAQE